MRNRKVKNMERFNIIELPHDIADLKRNAGKCPFCLKVTDDMRICLLCGFKCCIGCGKSWLGHLNQLHKGVSVTIHIQTGIVLFEALEVRSVFKCIYKNYLGQEYQFDKNIVKKGQFILDKKSYEDVLEKIAL